jgi:hypothetical protein
MSLSRAVWTAVFVTMTTVLPYSMRQRQCMHDQMFRLTASRTAIVVDYMRLFKPRRILLGNPQMATLKVSASTAVGMYPTARDIGCALNSASEQSEHKDALQLAALLVCCLIRIKSPTRCGSYIKNCIGTMAIDAGLRKLCIACRPFASAPDMDDILTMSTSES